uniref:Uncharacterized protein n=1 Tax=Pseudonaja textilis TaxID=8673 RepID=A0A670ZCB9_PSETE
MKKCNPGLCYFQKRCFICIFFLFVKTQIKFTKKKSESHLGILHLCLFVNLAPVIGSPNGLLSSLSTLKPFASLKNEVAAIQIRFPYKLLVSLERYSKEKILLALNRVKFLVPQDFTMGQFVAIILNWMGLRSMQMFYFLVDSNHSLVNMSTTMADVYAMVKNEDSFLK